MGNVIGRKSNQDEDESDIRASTSIEDITEFGVADSNLRRGRKRRKSYIKNNDDNTPTKLFKLDTPKYVYQKLFLEGSKSDVAIKALDHTWHLHRVYLEQTDYFRALFNGNWSDSNKKEYTLDIADENICFLGYFFLKYFLKIQIFRSQ